MRDRVSQWTCLIVAVALIVAMWMAQMSALTQGYYEPDPNGYVMSAKQLARHHTLRFDGSDLLRFHDHMWVEWSRNDVYAKYPPGYPLFLALAWLLGGDRGICWVSPFCGAIGMLASYFLMRKMASPWLALVGLACLTINPVLALYDGYILSHAASFAVVTVGMLCLWNWWEKGGIWRAALAGIVLGYAPWVRYTDAFMVLPAAGVILLNVFGVRPGSSVVPAEDVPARRWRWVRVFGEASVMVGGALLCVVPLMVHHVLAFGDPFRTGYSLSGEQQAFEWGNLKTNLLLLAHQLNGMALYMIFPLAILGFALLFARRRWGEGLVLTLWIVPTILAYGAYYWAPVTTGPIYVRFQISTFAAYFMAAAFLLHDALTGRAVRLVVPLALLVFLMAVAGPETVKQMAVHRARWPLEKAAQETAKWLPPDAVILADAPVNDYLQTIRDFKVYKLEYFNPGYSRRILQQYGNEPMRQKERAERISAYLGTDPERLLNMERDLVRRNLDADKTVALLAPQGSSSWLLRNLGCEFQGTLLSSWQNSPPSLKGMQNNFTWELLKITRSESASHLP